LGAVQNWGLSPFFSSHLFFEIAAPLPLLHLIQRSQKKGQAPFSIYSKEQGAGLLASMSQNPEDIFSPSAI